jgi:hypothetical protein
MTVYKFPGSPLLYVSRDGGFYPLSLGERDRAKQARAEKKLIARDGWPGEVL